MFLQYKSLLGRLVFALGMMLQRFEMIFPMMFAQPLLLSLLKRSYNCISMLEPTLVTSARKLCFGVRLFIMNRS